MTRASSPEELTLPLRTSEGFVMAAVTVDASGPVRVTVSPPGQDDVTGEGHDLIEALRDVRIPLEAAGLLLWVNGARRNVHASGVQRDMAQGRFAYVLPEVRTQARPLSAEVLQAPPPDADVVSVADQDEWYAAWLASPLQEEPAGQRPPESVRRTPPQPSPEARRAARTQPGGWVYDIVGPHDPAGAVPREAIRGAWQVDADGEIVGELVENPHFAASGDGRPGGDPAGDA